MKLTKNEIGIKTVALLALPVVLAVVAAIAMIDRKLFSAIDYTAVAVFVALATYWVDKYREERRMLASRGVVHAMALGELATLQSKIAYVQQFVPHEVTGLESTWKVEAEDIYYRDEHAVSKLAAAVNDLTTPVLNQLIEKLDALPKEHLLALGRILQLVAEIKQAPAQATRIDISEGSRAPAMTINLLDRTADKCAEAQLELKKLFDEWKASLA